MESLWWLQMRNCYHQTWPLSNSKLAKNNGKNQWKKSIFKTRLIEGLHQIPVKEEDIEKTAVISPFGLYDYLYMSFGLRNASCTFQRYMDNLFLNVDCAFGYLDNVLFFSETQEKHLKDLEVVLKILHDNNLRLSLDKCLFLQTSLDYLGFHIGSDGISPTWKKKTAEIKKKFFPDPGNSKSLRRFLGMVGFYRKLIPHFADIVFPLTEKIKNNPKVTTLILNTQELESFNTIKQKFAEVSTLPYPDSSCTNYHIVSDSSAYAIGATLHQIIDGTPVPVVFFFKVTDRALAKSSQFWPWAFSCILSSVTFQT